MIKNNNPRYRFFPLQMQHTHLLHVLIALDHLPEKILWPLGTHIKISETWYGEQHGGLSVTLEHDLTPKETTQHEY